MNFGDLPGDLKSSMNLTKIHQIIDADTKLTDFQKTKTKEAYDRIFNATDKGAIGFILQIQGLSVSSSVGSSTTFENKAKIEWDSGTDESTDETYYQSVYGGAQTGDPQSITITKKEEGTNNKLEGAKFKLQKQNANGVWEDYVPKDGGEKERLTNVNGQIVFKELEHGTYKVVEVSPPTGYTNEITFENDKDTFVIDGTEKGTIFITAYNKLELIKLGVVKNWEDGNNQDGKRPTSIAVELYKTVDGAKTLVDTQVLNEINDWKYNWKDLAQKESGKDVVYTVEEKNVPAGYTTSQTESNGVVTITNSYTPEVTQLEVIKKWDDKDDKDKIRPESIEVELYVREKGSSEKGTLKDTQILNKENNWTYKWNGLDKNKAGKELEYYVKEKDIPKGYTVNYTLDEKTNVVTITNSHTPVIPPTTEPPTEPTVPTEPTTPTEPTEPTIPTKPTKPTKPTTTTKPGKDLPKTGMVGTLGLGIAGIGLVLGGLYTIRNKKDDEQ